MTTQVSTKLDPSNVALRLGMCAAALAGTAATVQDANAGLVTFSTPITVPATSAGIYINLLTGLTGGSAAAVAGWDFNPYRAGGGTQLGFYWSDPAASNSGGVGTSAASGSYISLTPGSTVSAAATFTQAIALVAGSPFLTTGTHVLGFRFFNETFGPTGGVNYGYLTMTNTAANGFPTTITGWTFDNAGLAVTTPVPEAPTALMMSLGALALGATQLRKLRRQRQQAH